MGCDIHAVFQKKTPEGWEDVDSVWPQDRHYALFGWLAGVRGSVTPISEPRGFPEGFSFDLEAQDHNQEWMGDHSYSWLSAKEILEAPSQVFVRGGEEFHTEDAFGYFLDEVQRLQNLHGEVRLVFGFDS